LQTLISCGLSFGKIIMPRNDTLRDFTVFKKISKSQGFKKRKWAVINTRAINHLLYLKEETKKILIILFLDAVTQDTIIIIMIITEITMFIIQSDQKENKSEQALQIIGHVVAEFYANKRSMHGRRQFVVSNSTL
jgi:hypothetical protein